MQPNNNYVAIMAGGMGTRFWPQSRENMPKQFLDILGTGQSLLQSTYQRFSQLVPEENIYIVTNIDYIDLVQQQLPTAKLHQIIGEPARRNTAPCVAYMAHKLRNLNPNATFIVAPSDHHIIDEQNFQEILQKALSFATNNDVLLTLGIQPNIPHTGYGYIQFDEEIQQDGVYKVKTFTEKPDLALARQFLESGDFLWNSGLFIWNANTIIEAFEKYAPKINECFEDGSHSYNTANESKFIANAYSQTISKSIDYAVMEYADNVYVLPANFGWNDIGTWYSLWNLLPHDTLENASLNHNAFFNHTNNSFVVAPKKKLVVAVDLDGYCIVDTDDVLLICKIQDDEKFREIYHNVQQKNGKKYL